MQNEVFKEIGLYLCVDILKKKGSLQLYKIINISSFSWNVLLQSFIL